MSNPESILRANASEHPPKDDSSDIAPDQAAAVAALASGAALGGTRPLRQIDTHMSHVFLGEGWVYKLTRSRRHPFADMSSVEVRRRGCEDELRANAVWAPDLYEAVTPLTRAPDGTLRLGGSGAVVDWILILRRFDDGALLAEMADSGRLTAELVDRTAQRIAASHAALPRRRDAGHTADYRRIINGLRATDAAGAAMLGVRSSAGPLFDALEQDFTRHAPLLEARRRAGEVVRGHGDLHLGNICLYRGEVTPFDALGFDARLATADVLYDLAFLLMDLRARGLDAFATRAMNRYWDASATPEAALALLPGFMALRAAVRMAVAVERGDLPAAALYRQLGHDLLQSATPRLIAIGGLSGTGKSTLAQAIAPSLSGAAGGRVIRTDAIRKRDAKIEPKARLPAASCEPAAQAAVYRVLADQATAALKAGVSVIADAIFRDPAARAAVEHGAPRDAFQGLWLTAPDAVRIARVAARRDDVSDATPAIALAQTEPSDLSASWRIVDAARSPAELSAHAKDLLSGQPRC